MARSAPGRGAGPAVVVKLGGSLLEGHGAPVLGWLDVVARSRVPVVIVPGGGAFADLVRSEQRRLGFSDRTAHRMALVAMHQTALALADLQPARRRLVVCDGGRAIGDALAAGRVALWVPLPMTDGDPAIPEDWSITSDGLSAWLAARIGAREVVLVKSLPGAGRMTLAALGAAGAVDPEFARRVGDGAIPWRVLGPGDEARLADLVGTEAEMQPDAGAGYGPGSGKTRR